jgi:membrane fusion protein, multidrug efflux system
MGIKSSVYLLLALALATLSACEDPNSASKADLASRPDPSVTVTAAISKPVSATAEYIGKAKAFQSVELRARVIGYLLERPFKEGKNVKKGDVLFSIDQAQFVAVRDAAAAKVAGAKATLLEAEKQLSRYQTLTQEGTTSQANLDKAEAEAGKSRADLAAAKADLDRVELDVGYTKIISPINGRIGGSSVDVGNLIGPSSDVLATVVALDPIQVNFSVSERDYLNYSAARSKGESVNYTPRIKLANGQNYPHDGSLVFIDNRVDPSTGTIKVRVEFPNPDSLILPGQFMNVTLISSDPKMQVVVPQAAVQTNQSGPFVLVVSGDKTVEMRPVKTGQLAGIDVAITEGLEEGETIISEGIQKVRPGAKVNPVMRKVTR